MNHKITLALCLTASLIQASALLHFTRKAPGKHRIMAGIARLSSQAERDSHLLKSMRKLLQAQKEFITALKDGGNPMAQMQTSQGVKKRIIYEFMENDRSQEIAEGSYAAAGEKYRNVIGDIAAHRNNDTFFLQALADGMPLNDPSDCGGFFTPLHTYFARLKGYKTVNRGNLSKLILDGLDEGDLNSKNSSGNTVLDLIILSGDYDLIEHAFGCEAKPGNVDPDFIIESPGQQLHKGSILEELVEQRLYTEILGDKKKAAEIQRAIVLAREYLE
jgi:hypothetical protein